MKTKKTSWLRRGIEILILVGLTIVATLIYRFVDNELTIRMEVLKEDILHYLELQLGRKISYDNISPSVFMYLEVRDLKIYSIRNNEEELFRLKRVRVMYNLFVLLFSNDPLAAVSEINISNTLFKFNPMNASGNEAGELQKNLLSRLTSSNYLFRITGNNVSVHLYTENAEITFTHLFFEINSIAQAYQLNIKKGVATIVITDENGPHSFDMELKTKGSFDRDFSGADFIVKFLHFSTDTISFQRQTLQITLDDNLIDVRKIQDKSPIDLHLFADLNTGTLTFNFKTEKFQPQTMFRFTGPWEPFNQWLSSAITSSGTFDVSLGDPHVTYELSADIGLNHPSLPPGILVSARLHGDEEKVFLEPLVVNSRLGRIDFTGNVLFRNFFPEGFLRLVNVKVAEDKRVSADFKLDRSEESLSLRGTKLTVGASEFDLFVLDIFPRFDSFFFRLQTSFSQTPYTNTISSWGTLTLDHAAGLELYGELSSIPVSHIYKLFIKDNAFSQGRYEFLQRYYLSSEFTLWTDFEDFRFETDQFIVQDKKNDKNYLSMVLKGNNKEAFVEDFTADWENYAIEAYLKAEFGNTGGFSFQSSISVEGIPYSFSGYYTPRKTLHVAGNYGFTASFIFSRNADILFSAKALKIPIPVKAEKDTTVYLAFTMNGIFPAKGKWQIVSPHTIFYDIPLFMSRTNVCECAFVLNNDEMYVSAINYKDGISELSGSGEILFSVEGEEGISGDFYLEGAATGEQYSLSVTFEKEILDFRLVFDNSPAERIGKFLFSGSFSGEVAVTGPLGDIETIIDCNLVKGSLIGDHVGLETRIVLKENKLIVESLSLSFLSNKITRCTGEFHRTKGDFSFTGHYIGDYFRKDIQCNFVFAGNVVNMDKRANIFTFLDQEMSSTVGLSDISVDNDSFDPWSLSFTRKPDGLIVKGGPEEVFTGFIAKNGDFEFTIVKPFPIQGYAKGKIIDKNIDAAIEHIWIDTSVLNVILGEDIIKFTRGSIYGNDIAISGFFIDPLFSGTARAENVRLSFFLSKYDTEPFDVDLYFNDKQFILDNKTVQVGSGYVSVSRAIFTIDHWLPTQYYLNFSSDEYIGIYCVHNFGPAFVDGYGIGSIKVLGDTERAIVLGDIEASYSTVMLRDEPEQQEDEDLEFDFITDIALTSGRKVEFDWPTVTFPVLRCYSTKGSTVTVSYNTTNEKIESKDLENMFERRETEYREIWELFKKDEQVASLKTHRDYPVIMPGFVMRGSAGIKGGEVFYFNRNFYLKSGNIVFNVFDPEDIDPTVTVRAEIWEIDNETEEKVQIFLIAENNKLSEFSPRFESIPSRTETEIFALLGKSIQERIEESGFGLSVVLLSSEVLGEIGIFRSFEETVRELFNVDLFSIRTQIIENVVRDKFIDDQPVDEEYTISLGKYLDNTTITIGQYVGDDLFVTGLVRLTEVDYYSSDSLFGSGFFGVEPEFEISLEWPTPFFLLEWTFSPDQEHLDDLFFYLTDNIIKLEWNWKY
ncbi:MAG: translocation/assembly module TamB domain-containing protein [Spirochaetales bacterium]|nr:translocation/assembly module TamB domain-containing protein [Spirochaetales bacterium]